VTSHRINPVLICGLLLFFATEFSEIQGQSRSPVISVTSSLDHPLPPDHNLFKPSGGLQVSAQKPFTVSPSFSLGVVAGYNIGRMHHVTLGKLGSLSVISTEAIANLQWHLWKSMTANVAGGTGYYYAVENGESSSWATNLVWSGSFGIGVPINYVTSVRLHCEYRNFHKLYHLLGFGLGVGFNLDHPSG